MNNKKTIEKRLSELSYENLMTINNEVKTYLENKRKEKIINNIIANLQLLEEMDEDVPKLMEDILNKNEETGSPSKQILEMPQEETDEEVLPRMEELLQEDTPIIDAPKEKLPRMEDLLKSKSSVKTTEQNTKGGGKNKLPRMVELLGKKPIPIIIQIGNDKDKSACPNPVESRIVSDRGILPTITTGGPHRILTCA